MARQRWIPVAVMLGAIVGPLRAFAQLDQGAVTTGPASQAPTLALPLIPVLAALLACVAVYRLRLKFAGHISGLLLVATIVAGFGYAGVATITIDGGACGKQTTNSYDPFAPPSLMNNCPTPIHILAIQFTCLDPPPAEETCVVGATLASGERCQLPGCKR
ncbi:MAG TPA: hypothetical protein VMW17_14455 [Candidatus Binatia bacterium]|nr:hypothetical protein [Candidatus Binatia bacterium]